MNLLSVIATLTLLYSSSARNQRREHQTLAGKVHKAPAAAITKRGDFDEPTITCSDTDPCNEGYQCLKTVCISIEQERPILDPILYAIEFNSIGDIVEEISFNGRSKLNWNQTKFENLFVPYKIQCHEFSNEVCRLYQSLTVPPHGENVFDCRSRVLDDERELQFGSSNAEFFKGIENDKYNSKLCHSTNSTARTYRKDIIFSLAESYDCKKIASYLRNLRSTGCQAEVFLIRNDPFVCPEIESTCGEVSVLTYHEFAGMQAEVMRWIVALKWMHEHRETLSPCSMVLFSDFNDLLFQDDPFHRFAPIGADVVISEEFMYGPGTIQSPDLQLKVARDPDRLTLRNEVTQTNYNWVKHVAEEVTGKNCFAGYDCPVLNVGVIIGNFHGIVRFLHIFAYLSLSLDLSNEQLNSQGIVNYAYYQGLFSSVNLKVLPLGVSPYANAHAFHPPTRFSSRAYDPVANPFVNYFNESYAIVHMTNRFHFDNQLRAWRRRWTKGGDCGLPIINQACARGTVCFFMNSLFGMLLED